MEANTGQEKYYRSRCILSSTAHIVDQSSAERSHRSKVSNLSQKKLNLKKIQMSENKFTEIERENRILLEKIRSIVIGKPKKERVKNSFEPSQIKSLNKPRRLKEASKIDSENKKMLRRLQDARSHYEHTNTDQSHMKFLKGLGIRKNNK